MAELEASEGVKATFYLMPRSPYYNVFSHVGREQVRRIVDLGHRIGVHADLNEPRDSRITPKDAAIRAVTDYELLWLACAPVTRYLSLHCPPTSLLWQDVPRFVYAYAPAWEGKYLSDSRGVFAYGDPEDRETRPLQLNLHPEHWFPPANRPVEGFWR